MRHENTRPDCDYHRAIAHPRRGKGRASMNRVKWVARWAAVGCSLGVVVALVPVFAAAQTGPVGRSDYPCDNVTGYQIQNLDPLADVTLTATFYNLAGTSAFSTEHTVAPRGAVNLYLPSPTGDPTAFDACTLSSGGFHASGPIAAIRRTEDWPSGAALHLQQSPAGDGGCGATRGRGLSAHRRRLRTGQEYARVGTEHQYGGIDGCGRRLLQRYRRAGAGRSVHARQGRRPHREPGHRAPGGAGRFAWVGFACAPTRRAWRYRLR